MNGVRSPDRYGTKIGSSARTPAASAAAASSTDASNQASAAVSESPELCTAPMRYHPSPGRPAVAKVCVRRVASRRGVDMSRTTCAPLPTATNPSLGPEAEAGERAGGVRRADDAGHRRVQPGQREEPGGVRGAAHRRQHPRRHPGPRRRPIGPPAVDHVVEQRARCVARVGRDLAPERRAQPVLRLEDVDGGAITSGSFCSSQASVVAAKPVTAGEPSRLSSSVVRSRARARACSTDRPSAHRIAGRSGAAPSPVTTTPCIWPEKPTASGRAWVAAITSRTTSRVAASHSAGSLSAQPGRGADTAYRRLAFASTAPSSATSAALTDPVPRSMPRVVTPTRRVRERRPDRPAWHSLVAADWTEAYCAVSDDTGRMGARVVVVGSLNLDLVVGLARMPDSGETVFGDTLEQHAGGKGLNQAVAAARLGVPVSMIGALGTDAAGTWLRGVVDEEGIDGSAVAAIDGISGTALIEVDRAGANRIVVIPGANQSVTAEHVRASIARPGRRRHRPHPGRGAERGRRGRDGGRSGRRGADDPQPGAGARVPRVAVRPRRRRHPQRARGRTAHRPRHGHGGRCDAGRARAGGAAGPAARSSRAAHAGRCGPRPSRPGRAAPSRSCPSTPSRRVTRSAAVSPPRWPRVAASARHCRWASAAGALAATAAGAVPSLPRREAVEELLSTPDA